MLDVDEDALICDFAETYHILDIWALPVDLLATLASGLRENSRIKMKQAGYTYLAPEIVLPQFYDLVLAAYSDKKTRPRFMTDLLLGKHKKSENQAYRTPQEFDAARSKILERLQHG